MSSILNNAKLTASKIIDSKICLWMLIILAIIILGFIDYYTGPDFHFFLFYFLPTGIAAYKLGFLASILVSILCAGTWFTAQILGSPLYANSAVAAWNTSVRLIAYLSIGWSISTITELLNKERQLSAKMRTTLAEIKVLKGLLPICASCKKIRDDKGSWQRLESYIQSNSNAEFTHGICPECTKSVLEESGLAGK